MIRKVLEVDIKDIVKIEEDNFSHPLDYNFILNNISSPLSNYLLIEDDSIVLGYIGTMIYEKTCEVINFAVLKKYQKHGYGKKLLEYLISRMIENDFEEILLEVSQNNIVAKNMYYNFGFEQISVRKNYYSDGSNALILRKKLR